VKSHIVGAVIVAMLVGVMPIAPARAVLVLGQIASNGATLDGNVVPSGTTLLDPSTIATADDPAVIHLMNGNVIAMAAHSKASFSGESGGATTLAVESGEVVLRDRRGEPLLLAADASVLIQEEGVQEGESGPATTQEEKKKKGGIAWWGWFLIGGAAGAGVYAIVDSNGGDNVASPTTTR